MTTYEWVEDWERKIMSLLQNFEHRNIVDKEPKENGILLTFPVNDNLWGRNDFSFEKILCQPSETSAHFKKKLYFIFIFKDFKIYPNASRIYGSGLFIARIPYV